MNGFARNPVAKITLIVAYLGMVSASGAAIATVMIAAVLAMVPRRPGSEDLLPYVASYCFVYLLGCIFQFAGMFSTANLARGTGSARHVSRARLFASLTIITIALALFFMAMIVLTINPFSDRTSANVALGFIGLMLILMLGLYALWLWAIDRLGRNATNISAG